MTELRAELDSRVDGDTRIKIAVTHLVTNEGDAREAGRLDRELISAYVEGYCETDAG